MGPRLERRSFRSGWNAWRRSRTFTPTPVTLTVDNLRECFDDWRATLPAVPADGRLVRYPWELVEHNAAQILADFPHAASCRSRGEAHALSVVGPLGDVLVHPSARIEPMVLADTSGGPVVVDHGAVVTAFTRNYHPTLTRRL